MTSRPPVYDQVEMERQKTKQYRIVALAILAGIAIVLGSVTTVIVSTVRADRLQPKAPDGTIECKWVPRGTT